jgi:hypothetical protein
MRSCQDVHTLPYSKRKSTTITNGGRRYEEASAGEKMRDEKRMTVEVKIH